MPYSVRLVTYVFAALAFLPLVHAVDPPPDGGYEGENTAEGEDALFNLTTGATNTAIGFNALYGDTTGTGNTATGARALLANTTGARNTASGSQALRDNNGDNNSATGYGTLSDNTSGYNNTATGALALTVNTTGYENVANGYVALEVNTTGNQNVANGAGALSSNTTGYANTANGYSALSHNLIGNRNTADGYNALLANTYGKRNTAVGSFSLYANITGNHNVALGWSALLGNTTGNRNIGLGDGAGENLTTGDNNIDIGNSGVADESQTIRVGTQGTHTTTYVAGISGSTVADGVGVVVGADGHLGTTTSSVRFKEQIKPMDKTSEAILSLEPVTFRYKHELDPAGIRQFGLVAEQVERINPDLVVRDDQGKPYTVRYDAVNAMLLNEFLKAHKRLEEQAEISRDLEDEVATLKATLSQQGAQIRRVSDQLALTDSSSQVSGNNR